MYPDKDDALVATTKFGLNNASLTGVGFFPVHKDGWKSLGKDTAATSDAA